ncbi:MAG: biotin--[acetyl-CoA-carboxylase] ligase [Candidatus Methanomethylicia archaeon]
MEIIEVEEVDSTQNLARRLLEIISGDFIVIAKKQTSGYGRKKSKWFSPDGGLWFTLVIRREELNLNILPIIVSVSIAKVLEKSINVDVQLKWPNDIYMKNKKIGGIICEAIIIGERINAILIGVGLNVNIDEIPEEIKDKATSMKIETGKTYDNNKLLREIVNEIYGSLKVDIKEIINYWRNKDITINKRIRFTYKGKIIEGIVLDINDDGSLKILTDNYQNIYHWEIDNIEILN